MRGSPRRRIIVTAWSPTLMRMKRLVALETRFRRARDRVLGRWLYRSILLSRALLAHLGNRGDIILRQLPDHWIAIDPADHKIGRKILDRGAWQRKELDGAVGLAAETGNLRPGRIFVDIGANIGTQTLYAMLTGRFRAGLAMEPVPRNAELLRLNLKLNDLADRVMLVESAVGARHGDLTLSLSHSNRGGHSSRKRHAGSETIDVPVAPLDWILADQGLAPGDVGFVWIDAEGAEPEILAGMADVLDRAPPLALEWSPDMYSADERAAMITSLGRHYSGFVDLQERFKFERDAPLRPVTALDGVHEQTDVLFLATAGADA